MTKYEIAQMIRELLDNNLGDLPEAIFALADMVENDDEE